jgi:hypothetical protein
MLSALPPTGQPSNCSAIAPLPELIDALPNLCGHEQELQPWRQDIQPIFLNHTRLKLDQLSATFAIALHMHQPIIPDADGQPMSYLQYMFEHPFEGDNHRAGTFTYCYSRIANFIIDLVNQGYRPRVMLNYSGTLLWGLRRMGRGDVLAQLTRITTEATYSPYVEWLGTFWGHAIAPNIPVTDYALHIQAWQQHFAALFGADALRRVRGFALPDLRLPADPDALYSLLLTLKQQGYRWLLVRADQICQPDGSAIAHPHLPHQLTVANHAGESASITVLVQSKAATPDGLARMEPYAQATALQPESTAMGAMPPIVMQWADGENTHAMMHDFPAAFRNAWYDVQRDRSVAGVTGTEYLELLGANGFEAERYLPCQVAPMGHSPAVSAELRSLQMRLHQRFHTAIAAAATPSLSDQPFTRTTQYRAALVHYLLTQTSCFQHWSDPQWRHYWQMLYQKTEALLRPGF